MESKHVTRFSDSSLYDEVCMLCGAIDDGLESPCKAMKRIAYKTELDAFREWNLEHGNQEAYKCHTLEILLGYSLCCTQINVAVGCYIIDERTAKSLTGVRT